MIEDQVDDKKSSTDIDDKKLDHDNKVDDEIDDGDVSVGTDGLIDDNKENSDPNYKNPLNLQDYFPHMDDGPLDFEV